MKDIHTLSVEMFQEAIKQLEPKSCSFGEGEGRVLTSIAISLKRIADYYERSLSTKIGGST